MRTLDFWLSKALMLVAGIGIITSLVKDNDHYLLWVLVMISALHCDILRRQRDRWQDIAELRQTSIRYLNSSRYGRNK